MTKTNRPKKPRKGARSTSGKLDAHGRDAIEQYWARELKPAKKRPKLRRQWELSTLATLLSLGLEREDVPSKVNRRKREAGLPEPAPLPVADAVGGEHPALGCFTNPQLSQVIDDFAVLDKRYSRLFVRLASRQAELNARVALAEAALERLTHNQTEGLNFIYSGTPSAPLIGAIRKEVATQLAADLPRRRDPASTHEVGYGAPLDADSGVSQGGVGVPLVEEAGNPYAKYFPRDLMMAVGESLGLKSSSPIPQRSRLSRFVRKCVAQVRRLLDACARRITEFEPKVR